MAISVRVKIRAKIPILITVRYISGFGSWLYKSVCENKTGFRSQTEVSMRVLKKTTAFLLSLIMIFGLLPAAYAVDAEPEVPEVPEDDYAVLKSLGHERANEIFMFSDEEEREALLTVPFLYAEAHDKLDLFNGRLWKRRPFRKKWTRAASR